MLKLSSLALLVLGTGATIIAARPASREGEFATPPTAEFAVTVSGRVALLGSGRDARDVASAVVYLEPLAPPPAPRPVAPPVAPLPVVSAPPPVVAPRDTVRVLWDAVRELRQTVAELREALRQVRAQFLSTPDARAAGVPPNGAIARVLDSAATPSATPPTGATPVNVPTGAPAGSPGSTVAAPRPAARVVPGATMAMREKTFEPHVRIVEAGGLVEYPNRDPFSHNVFSTTPGGAFDLGLYPRGDSRGVVFRRMGAYAIYCNIHSKMSAFIVAVPSALHAQPDESGRFSIANVPAGRYRLHVWHERAPEQVTSVVVADRPVTDVAVTLDARTFQTAAHLNKFGQPYRAATRDAY